MAKLPMPPAPTAPAMVVRPIRLIAVTVTTRIRSGTASCRYTRKIMPSLLLPMAVAASTLPGSTPASATSTCLVKKGAVPTMKRVSGIRKISRITKGIERKMLVTRSTIR